MKKARICAALLCVAMLIGTVPFGVTASGGTTDPVPSNGDGDATVFLDGTGATPDAYTDIASAFRALPDGGTVLLCGNTTVGTTSSGVTLPAAAGCVTVRGTSPSVTLTMARSLTLSSAVVFDDLVFRSTATASGNILCNGNAITFGDGVSSSVASGAMIPAIFGGASGGTRTYNTSVTVRGGKWRAIYGGGFDGTMSGTSTVLVSGTVCTGTISAGNYNGTCNAQKSLTVDLRGEKTVKAAAFGKSGETVTCLTDPGYEAVLLDGTYSEQPAAPVLLDGTGKTEGAYTDLKSAIAALPGGGTVIVKGDTTIGTASAGVTLPATAGKVTVIGDSPEIRLILARSLTLGGEIGFDRLTFYGTHATLDNIIANGHALTMGPQISTGHAEDALAIGLIGGTSGANITCDTSLTVLGGTWRVIYGGSYGGTMNGSSIVTVSGTTVINTLSAGNYTGTCNAQKTLIVDLRGGKTVKAGTWPAEPTEILVDDKYEAVFADGTYSEQPITTVRLDGTGKTEGAYTDLKSAIAALPGGGTVLVTGNTTVGTASAGVTLPATTGKILVRGETPDVVLTIARSLFLSGEIEFDDLVIHSTATASGNIVCFGNALTMGKGITTTKAGGSNVVWLAIFGGATGKNTNYHTSVTLLGGSYRAVYGGNFDSTMEGTSSVLLSDVSIFGTASANNYSGTCSAEKTLTFDLRGGSSVRAEILKEPPALLLDPGYEAVTEGAVYYERKIQYPPRTVYLDGTGKTEGAYTSLSDALSEMPGGGTVILSGNTAITSAVSLPETDPVTVTSVYGDEDYRDTAALRFAADLTLGGDTVFRDVVLEKIASGNIYLIAKGHALTVDTGVACLNYTATNHLSIIGGDRDADFAGDTHITVKSGTWRNLFAANYNGAFVGNTYATVTGGSFDNAIVGGSFSGDFTGDTHLLIGGNASLPYRNGTQGVVGATLGSDGGIARLFRGNVYLTLEGQCGIASNVTGGPRNNNISMEGDVEIRVKDNAFVYFSLYAGGYAKGINGNTHVIIDGGDVQGNLFGGSHAGTVTGDTLIEINGGKLCYYETNGFSGGSSPAGTKNVFAGGEETSEVGGIASLFMRGGSVYGNVSGGDVTLSGGRIAGNVSGSSVSVDLSDGGTLEIGEPSSVDRVIGGGTLRLAAAAPLTASSLAGSVTLAVNGLPLPISYLTVGAEEAGSAVTYLPQNDETLVHNGSSYAIDFAGAQTTVCLTVTYRAGCTCRLRDLGLKSGSWYTPDFTTETSATYRLVPGLYTATVVYTDDNTDYQRKSVYITGRTATQETDISFEKRTDIGFGQKPAATLSDDMTEQYFGTDTLKGYQTPDTPYFNDRPGSEIFTTNEELATFLGQKAAGCGYMYVFDLCRTPSGYSLPMALFTKDPLPVGVTPEQAAKIVTARDDRDILLFTGGIHGNEPSGTEGTLAFISEMCTAYGERVFENESIGAILVIPRQNPEGFFTFTRESAENTAIPNLNRDFMALTSAEIAACSYIDRIFKPTLAVDCHEAGTAPVWSAGQTLTDLYDIGVMYFANFASPVIHQQSILAGDRSAAYGEGDQMVSRVLDDLSDSGLRTYWYTKDRSSIYGANNRGINGAYAFVMEVPGISGGASYIARRTYAQVTGLKSFVSLAIASNGSMARTANQARRDLALSAQIYDGRTPVVLLHGLSRTAENAYVWNDPLIGPDGTVRVADNLIRGFNYDIAMKYRTLPTAYVFPADTERTDDILSLLDRQGVPYFRLPEDTALMLRQYSGSTNGATLSERTSVTFVNGAYIVPVDGERAYTAAYLFEPDNADTDGNPCSLSQMNYLPVSDIYRSEESLIAAKLGLPGTYLALPLCDGKTLSSVTVDGTAYPANEIRQENGCAYVIASDRIAYDVTVAYTDESTENIHIGPVKGDIDGDGSLTNTDITLLLQYLARWQTVTVEQYTADLTEDGRINNRDLILLIRALS